MMEEQLVEGIGDFLPLCEETENLSYLVKSQFMKYTVTQKPKVLQKVYELFDEMVGKEKTMVSGMLDVIQKQIEHNKRLEAVPWASRHDFVTGTHKLDAPQSKRLTIDFDVTPHQNGIDGVIGYGDSQSQPVGYAALKLLVRFHPDGYWQARNGDQYSAAATFGYENNKSYHVRITVDFERRNYSAQVSFGRQAWRLAENYTFGPLVGKADDLKRVTITVNNYASFSVEHHCVAPE